MTYPLFLPGDPFMPTFFLLVWGPDRKVARFPEFFAQTQPPSFAPLLLRKILSLPSPLTPGVAHFFRATLILISF